MMAGGLSHLFIGGNIHLLNIGEISFMTQSWIRKGFKKLKKKNNKALDRKILYYKFDSFIQKTSHICLLFYFVLILIIFGYKKWDLSIASLSLLLLIVSFFKKKFHSQYLYELLLILTLFFGIFLFVFIVKSIPYEEIIARVVSIISLIISVIIEFHGILLYDKSRTQDAIEKLQSQKKK